MWDLAPAALFRFGLPGNSIGRGELEKCVVVIGVGSDGGQIGEGSGRGSGAKRGSGIQKEGVGGRRRRRVSDSVVHNGSAVEGVEEPRLGFGVGNEGEEEEPDAGRGGAVVLVEEDVEIVVGGEGDEGVQLQVGKLVLDREGGAERESAREVGNQGGEGGDGAALH